MKIALAAFMLGAAIAGSAAAAEEVSDSDYIAASRCRGLAVGSGAADTKVFDEFLKGARRSRVQLPEGRAELEFDRARREAKRSGGKESAAAELSAACAAYASGAKSAASPT